MLSSTLKCSTTSTFFRKYFFFSPLPFQLQNYCGLITFPLLFEMLRRVRHHVCHCLQRLELGKHWPLQVSAWGGVGLGAKFVCTHLRQKSFISTLACSRMRRVYSVKSGTHAYTAEAMTEFTGVSAQAQLITLVILTFILIEV